MKNQSLLRFLEKNHLVFACAESCTGGWIARKATSVPGASRYFWGGVVVYSNDAKQSFLGVPEEVLQVHGAVSGPCALAMARGLFAVSHAPINLSVTGIAGPDGGSLEKPVGTVWFGLAGAYPALAVQMCFPGDRRSIQRQAVHFGRTLMVLWWKAGGSLDSPAHIPDNKRNCYISSFFG